MDSPKNAEEWFKTNLEPHVPVVRAWLESRYGDRIDVDDTIQDALFRVLKVWNEREVNAPKSYLFAVSRNLAFDALRRQQVLHMEPINTLDDCLEIFSDDVAIEETAARNHELEILTEAIQSLPERCRQAFTLSKVYGMTYKEIAKEMGVSFNTVSTQIAQGLSRCTKYMQQCGRD